MTLARRKVPRKSTAREHPSKLFLWRWVQIRIKVASVVFAKSNLKGVLQKHKSLSLQESRHWCVWAGGSFQVDYTEYPQWKFSKWRPSSILGLHQRRDDPEDKITFAHRGTSHKSKSEFQEVVNSIKLIEDGGVKSVRDGDTTCSQVAQASRRLKKNMLRNGNRNLLALLPVKVTFGIRVIDVSRESSEIEKLRTG